MPCEDLIKSITYYTFRLIIMKTTIQMMMLMTVIRGRKNRLLFTIVCNDYQSPFTRDDVSD